MPSRHRPAESSRVMSRPANLTWPASGDRSPEIRPNRLVLPAPFGPTIPTVSPALTENDRSSAMTTRPNRFVTWSSSSNGLLSAHLKVGSRCGGNTVGVWPALRAGLSILVSHVLEISFVGARRVALDHVRMMPYVTGRACWLAMYALRTPVRTRIVNKLAKRYERPQLKSTHVM